MRASFRTLLFTTADTFLSTSWGEEGSRWIRNFAGTIDWVRGSNVELRATTDFRHRLWEDNPVAAVGQGHIRVDEVVADEKFRGWLAVKSMEALPASTEARPQFLTQLYEAPKKQLDQIRDVLESE